MYKNLFWEIDWIIRRCFCNEMEVNQKIFVSRDRKEKLPLDKTELQKGLESGTYTEETLAWAKGMPNWLPLSDPYWEKYGIIVDSCMPPELPPLEMPEPKPPLEELKVVAEEKLDYKGEVAFYESLPFTGIGVDYHENGQKRKESHYKGGKEDGPVSFWYQSGQKESEATYKEGRVITDIGWQPNGEVCPFTNVVNGNGTVVTWHENGQKESESHYRDGQKCGLQIVWNENGLKKEEINHDYGNKGECLATLFWDNGNKQEEGCGDGNTYKQVGIWVKFSEDGKADGEIHYINGQTHYKIVTRHENGEIKSEEEIKDGEDKFVTKYYDNGQKQGAGFLNQDGEKEGFWTWWYKNGQKEQEEECLRGECRIIKEWDEEGRVRSQNNNQGGNWMQKAAWLQRQTQINQMNDFFGG